MSKMRASQNSAKLPASSAVPSPHSSGTGIGFHVGGRSGGGGGGFGGVGGFGGGANETCPNADGQLLYTTRDTEHGFE